MLNFNDVSKSNSILIWAGILLGDAIGNLVKRGSRLLGVKQIIKGNGKLRWQVSHWPPR